MRTNRVSECRTPVYIDLRAEESTVSHPHPDVFYSPSQVPSHVEDPVGEVLMHSTEVIRRRINRRKAAAVSNQVPIARYVKTRPIHETTLDHRPRSAPTTSTATNTEPLPIPASRAYRDLIARQQSTMRHNINSDPRNGFLDTGTCHYHLCPYSVGGLMAQRFALMQRLRQINMILYGDEEHFGE